VVWGVLLKDTIDFRCHCAAGMCINYCGDTADPRSTALCFAGSTIYDRSYHSTHQHLPHSPAAEQSKRPTWWLVRRTMLGLGNESPHSHGLQMLVLLLRESQMHLH
jgi:hypothetical protein